MASSKWFGSRSSSPWMRASSPSVSPRARWSGCSATELRTASYPAVPTPPRGCHPPGLPGLPGRPGSLSQVSVADRTRLGGAADAYLPGLIVLSCLWGSSYPFIRVAVRDIGPAAMIDARLLIAAPLLLAYVAWSNGLRETVAALRRWWLPCVVLGVFNVAGPYTAISWAEQHIDSGTAAIATAAVPIFVVLLAIRFQPDEKASRARFVGLGIGLGGVGLLAGVNPGGGWPGIAGALVAVASSVAYAASGLYAKAQLENAPGQVLGAGSVAVGATLLIPLAAFQLGAARVTWSAGSSVVGLAILGTAGAQVAYFHMLPRHGAGRVAMVAFLIPVVSLVIGAGWLGEAFTAPKLGGLALILGGVALGSGMWVPSRRSRPPRGAAG